jgi:hypothetical protein
VTGIILTWAALAVMVFLVAEQIRGARLTRVQGILLCLTLIASDILLLLGGK